MELYEMYTVVQRLNMKCSSSRAKLWRGFTLGNPTG